ncbi:hypothetical protein L2D00_10290 [Hyphomonadaceae bacterium BL14]|nr:hypothetical protein L2D00_10290 [Hyphomonadaceae bacterium BL14]
MTTKARKPTDWRKRLRCAKPAKTVTLHADFGGVKAGTVMFIATPEIIAGYVAAIPPGETRSVPRLRNELARRYKAQATCPVTTAIYLRVVAEAALTDLAEGAETAAITPFWRVIDPGSAIARRLTCGDDFIRHQRALEDAAPDA